MTRARGKLPNHDPHPRLHTLPTPAASAFFRSGIRKSVEFKFGYDRVWQVGTMDDTQEQHERAVGDIIIQNLPGNRESLQRDRIRTALTRKCPKLLQSTKDGRVSILVLESDDIALANRHSIANATIAEISARDDAPDIVVWARTSTNPWKAWFLKDGDATHPNVSMAGPYALHPDAYPPSVALQRRIK